jgi:hypothetical protein
MSERALSIVGSSRSNGERDPLDFYPTPPEATTSLITREPFIGSIWEPACGDGAISKVLVEKGYDVYSSDIEDRGYGDKYDFLAVDKNVDNIVTNPPFKLALEFLQHAKTQSNKKIALFLKTIFLEGITRYEMFQDKEFPLKCMYQFCRRVKLQKSGTLDTKNGGMIAFAWFVWDKEYVGKPYIEWISE